MHLDLLRAFFEIVAHGSLNKAAAYLRVSQSTLTRQLRALETEIGGALLERGPGGIALTASGHALVETMRPELARFDAALGEVGCERFYPQMFLGDPGDYDIILDAYRH